MNVTGTGSCPMTAFDNDGVESLVSAMIMLVNFHPPLSECYNSVCFIISSILHLIFVYFCSLFYDAFSVTRLYSVDESVTTE
jgi:hypothetical protein